MIRPILYLLILFIPFLIIGLHKKSQLDKNKHPEKKWHYIYIIFLFSYVLFVFYTAEVFIISK